MRKYLTLTFCGLLAGCSTLPESSTVSPPPQTPPAAVQPTAAPEEETAGAVSTASLEPDLLYHLLVAEFAGQRGDLALSARNYLEAARATGDPQVARRAVHVAVYSRDYARALAGAQLWVELDPENVEARQSLAALLIKAGQLDEATEHLKKVLTVLADEPAQGYGLLVNLLGRERDGDRALTVMTNLLGENPEHPDALFAFAQLAAKLGKNEEALKALDQLLAQEPELVRALTLKANLLHRMGEPDGAVAAMEAAVAAEPGNTDLRLAYARLLVDARRLEHARKQFRRLENDLPDSPDIAYALGLLAMQAEELDEAEGYFRKLLDSGDRKNEAAYALGQIAEARKDPEQAIQWYQSVGGDTFMDARLRVARIVADRDGLDAARDYLNGLELASPEQRLRRILAEGALLTESGRHQDALAVYSRGLEAFEGNPDLLYARAMAAERVDRLDLLESDLRAILEADPDNTQALNALGYTLADRTNRYEEARQLIERAYEQAPDDPAIIDSLGWVHYRLGDHEQALKYLRRALSLQNDGEIAAHLGEVLWVTGQKAEAREIWNEALEYAPDHELLQSVIQRFTAP